MSKKPTYSDLMTVPTKDIQRIYKIDDRTLEQTVRKEFYGASKEELNELYKDVYNTNRKQ